MKQQLEDSNMIFEHFSHEVDKELNMKNQLLKSKDAEIRSLKSKTKNVKRSKHHKKNSQNMKKETGKGFKLA